MANELADGNDPRNKKTSGPMSGGTAPGGTILGPKTKWNPGPIPARAAMGEADESIGGTISTTYDTGN